MWNWSKYRLRVEDIESINGIKLIKEKEGIKMQDFEITHMETERRMHGVTYIRARCIEDQTLVDVEIPNTLINDKSFVKLKLLEEYNRLLKLKEKHKDDIQVDTIL